MLLAVDIGNSNIVYGVYHNGGWQHQWREETDNEQPLLDQITAIGKEFSATELSPDDVESVILSSVVPHCTPAVLGALLRLFGEDIVTVVDESTYRHLPIHILNPQEIGSDLVANAVAGFMRFQNAAVTVVDFGTALTFTTISSKGHIMGVSIAPGLNTAIKSLFNNTAALPEVPLDYPESVLGINTIHAIQSGVLMGYTGMVKYMIEQIKSELNCQIDTTHFVIATGGLSSILTPLKDVVDDIDPILTLEGLRLISEFYQDEQRLR